MTVSGTVAFSLTVSEIVTEARGLLGIQAAEEPLQAVELAQGIRALNMMLNTWQADGVKTWTLTEGTFTLVQGTASYLFGSGGTFTTVPLELTDVRLTRDSIDLPIQALSRQEYFALPNKTTQSRPVSYYYDRQRDTGRMYVWPTADSGLGTIGFTYRRHINDAGDGTNTLDLPDEWAEAVCYGLAKRLLPYYPKVDKTGLAAVLSTADATYAIVKAFDVAEGENSITITPDWDYR